MRVTYQIQIGEGQTIAYEIGENTDIGKDALRELLALVSDAAACEKAKFELPFHKARLHSNLERLGDLRKRRAEAEAHLQAHVTQLSARGDRRREAQPLQTDVNAVAQWDKQIADTEAVIANDRLRIPYLEAIIAGREPPDLFPETQDSYPMAAE